MTTSGTRFHAMLAEHAGAVEARLTAWLGDEPRVGELARPPRLMAAMRHAALAGGKRLRPFLTIESARLFGVVPQAALAAACAIECLHCYSLVHDDLPAMDDDDLRRGRPTVHRAFDEATAILAGDGLLTLAFEALASPEAHPDPAFRVRLVLGLARAGGLGGMVGGQMLDLAAEGRYGAPIRDVSATRQLQAMKTGALLAFAAEAGAIIGGADEARQAAVLRYGRALGAAFQVADDILDRTTDAATLGKATAKDAEKGKATLVDLIGMDAAVAERDRLADEAIAALDPFGEAAALLREAALFTARRAS